MYKELTMAEAKDFKETDLKFLRKEFGIVLKPLAEEKVEPVRWFCTAVFYA